ncbi:hypothetical protein KHU50_008249 [Colletotrichum sp. SAR 10_65]|nr:hypothetical protein KHU50_008249 [Colletotrichum sp. SAR 10_65]
MNTGFQVFKIQSESLKLGLTVRATQEDDIAGIVPIAPISSLVHGLSRLHEWVRKEALGSDFWLPDVSDCNLNAREVNVTDRTWRSQSLAFV